MLSAFPVGFFLAYLTKDELKSGKKWFKLFSIVSLVISIILIPIYLIFKLKTSIPIMLALLYFTIVSLISYQKLYK
jgi:hypothetical protein